MRNKKAAPQTRKRRKASSRKQSGLIAQDKNAQQSAMTKSALDNHSHRTLGGGGCTGTITTMEMPPVHSTLVRPALFELHPVQLRNQVFGCLHPLLRFLFQTRHHDRVERC